MSESERGRESEHALFLLELARPALLLFVKNRLLSPVLSQSDLPTLGNSDFAALIKNKYVL